MIFAKPKARPAKKYEQAGLSLQAFKALFAQMEDAVNMFEPLRLNYVTVRTINERLEHIAQLEAHRKYAMHVRFKAYENRAGSEGHCPSKPHRVVLEAEPVSQVGMALLIDLLEEQKHNVTRV